MQALILAGGEGTRLRPLTSTVPKPVVPLVDRPFIAFMLEWLRGHGVDDVVMSCGFMASRRAQRARRRLGLRDAPALRRGAETARHRRRGQVRRGPARRALPDAQRRRADRHRPDRAARAARAHGRPRDARARAGRGPVRVRARAPQRRPSVQRVPREAEPRPDRHEPDQRRRLRAAPRRARRRAAEASTSRSSARSSRRSSATGLYGYEASTATGSTSARPSATCRRRTTSSTAPSRPSVTRRLRRRPPGDRRGRRAERPRRRPGARRRRRASPRARS